MSKDGWMTREEVRRRGGPWRVTGRCWGRRAQISGPKWSLVVPVSELHRYGIKL